MKLTLLCIVIFLTGSMVGIIIEAAANFKTEKRYYNWGYCFGHVADRVPKKLTNESWERYICAVCNIPQSNCQETLQLWP